MALRFVSRALLFGALLCMAVTVRARAQELPPSRASEVELFDYTVVEGDSCAAISERFFGDRRRYDLIHAYNPDMGPPPHDLAPGTVLRLPRRAVSTEDLADATVTGVERRVEARPRPIDEAWIAAERGLGLYRGGRVATQRRSAAELTFRDTSVVQLREQTLIIIFGPTSSTTRTAGMEATLETGALRTRLGELRGDESGGNTLRVVTGAGTATLEGGSAIVGVDEQGTSRLSNHSSRARLAGSSGGRAVTLPENTGSMVARGGRPTPPRPLPAAPTWQAGSRRFLGVAGIGGELRGRWAAVPGASRYRVEIARQPDGRDVVFASEVPAEVTGFEARRLPAGVFYVTVATLDGDLFEGRPSAAERFEILDGRVVAPGEDASAAPPAYDPGDPAVEPAARIEVLEGTRFFVPDGVTCGGPSPIVLRAGERPSCTDASGAVLEPPPFDVARSERPVDTAPGEPVPEPRPSVEPGVSRPVVPAPAPASDTASAPPTPRLTEGFARSPVVSALSLTDLDRRGSVVGLGVTEIAPAPRAVGPTERTRIAVSADLSLLDDQIQLGTLVPFDVAGRASATWEAGSLDVYAHARWIPLRRDPTARDSLALAIDLGAWFPTHPEGLTADDRSGLPLVRLAPSIELAYAFARVASFRMRQGALLDLDDTGARLWASAYGLDLEVLRAMTLGVEVDLALGTELEASLFAIGLATSLAVELDPVVLGLGLRFGLNRDGQALFGAAAVAVSGSVAF